MKVKEITLKKEIKIGMPNYSNQTTGLYITWELGEHEEFDYEKGWDLINGQLDIQGNTIDPAWIINKETKGYYKTTVKIPKQEEMEVK